MAMSASSDNNFSKSDVIHGARDSLNKLEVRFSTFTQQQFSFIAALDRCRQAAFEPSKTISTISQVTYYCEHVSTNATDKRIMGMFLELVKDLNEFRRKLVKMTRQSDSRLETVFAKWKKTLEPTQNNSQLRVQFPNSHLNHLSVTESRLHFGGIVSVLPTAMDCARDALNRIDSTRAYRRIESAGRDSGRSNSSLVYRNAFSAQGYRCIPKKPSPLISSPVPSHTISHPSLKSGSLENSKLPPRCRFRSPPPSRSYQNQVNSSKFPQSTTQTPKFLVSTVKPMLDWQNQSLSEEEIRKILKERKRGESARPKWKP